MKSLLTWEGQVGPYPPGPNRKWKGPTPTTFTIDWAAAMNTKWNQQLPPLFVDLFLAKHEEYRGHPEATPAKLTEWFKTHCAHLKRKRRNQQTAKTPGEVQTGKQARAAATRRANVSIHSISERIFLTFGIKLWKERKQACTQIAELKQFRQIVVDLGPEGMSDDEKDASGAYLIKRVRWRAKALTKVLRTASKGYKVLLRRSSGSPGRHRIPSNLIYDSVPVKALPGNGYDEDWRDDRDTDEERDLDARPDVDLTIPESLLRWGPFTICSGSSRLLGLCAVDN